MKLVSRLQPSLPLVVRRAKAVERDPHQHHQKQISMSIRLTARCLKHWLMLIRDLPLMEQRNQSRAHQCLLDHKQGDQPRNRQGWLRTCAAVVEKKGELRPVRPHRRTSWVRNYRARTNSVRAGLCLRLGPMLLGPFPNPSFRNSLLETPLIIAHRCLIKKPTTYQNVDFLVNHRETICPQLPQSEASFGESQMPSDQLIPGRERVWIVLRRNLSRHTSGYQRPSLHQGQAHHIPLTSPASKCCLWQVDSVSSHSRAPTCALRVLELRA